MRPFIKLATLAGTLMLSACVNKGTNPDDPYEPFNRRVYRFNAVVDKTVLKPAAKVYAAVIPPKIRAGINNVYDNVNMLPTLYHEFNHRYWGYI